MRSNPSSSKPIFFRKALVSDAGELASLSVKAFRAAYEAFNTPEDMDAYCRNNFSAEAILHDLNDHTLFYLLAFRENEIIAYAKLNLHPGKKPGANYPLEIARLYTKPELIGQGIGKAMTDEIARMALEKGYDSVCLDVWQRNFRAVNFYWREGFFITGTTTFTLGSDVQDDYVMVRKI